MTKKSPLDYALISISFYVAFALISNIISTKIAIIPILALAVDGGTILYPFTFRDFVHKTIGKTKAQQLIIVTALLNAIMVGAIWLVGISPSAPEWEFQADYQNILMGSIGRIVIASIIAQIISELIDTEIFSKIYKKGREITAVILSNTAGLIIDSIIFAYIAFAGATMPTSTLWEIILVNFLIKLTISLFSAPLIKLIPRKVNIDKI